jgi:hypothetical protein
MKIMTSTHFTVDQLLADPEKTIYNVKSIKFLRNCIFQLHDDIGGKGYINLRVQY